MSESLRQVVKYLVPNKARILYGQARITRKPLCLVLFSLPDS